MSKKTLKLGDFEVNEKTFQLLNKQISLNLVDIE